MCPPPPLRASIGTGSICWSNCAKDPPLGGMIRKVSAQIPPGVLPSPPIEVVWEEYIASLRAWLPDWGQGGPCTW